MLLGILGVEQLPAVSTFWRYLQSIGHNQSMSLLRLMGVLRERAWKSLGIDHECIHIDMDTTVETVYGLIQGAKRGHNPGHRGKKGLRPVLAFIVGDAGISGGEASSGGDDFGSRGGAIHFIFCEVDSELCEAGDCASGCGDV